MLHQFFRKTTFSPIQYFVKLKSTQKNRIKELLLKMPKNKTHVEQAQKERIRIKERSSKYTPGTVNIQVLGSGAPGSPASVYLFTDQTRYLFNCGEGTQRLAHEHKTKLARLEHIFMTRTCWDRVGGLPGLSLTVQDAGVPNLNLHGPPGLAEIFSGMRKFVVLKHLRVSYINCEQEGRFEDQVMDVTYVPLNKVKSPFTRSDEKQSLVALHLDETDYYAHERSQVQPSPPSTISNAREEENLVMSYICKLKPRPGMLNLEKCVEFGVPPGPLLGQLKNGFDVTLENGTTVRADDVRGPTDPGAVFIFIDIPSEEYLQALEDSSQIFGKYQASAVNQWNIASVVVHFSPPEMFQKTAYKNFINKFPASTKHMVLNSTNIFSGYLAVHRIQWQLNLVDKDIFPIIKENFASPIIANERKKIKLSPGNESVKRLEKVIENNNDNLCLEPVSALTLYHLRPRKGLDRGMESSIKPEEYINECEAIEGFSESLTEFKNSLLKFKSLKINENWEFPKIIFLGTGSCIPNKTRNVSAILVQTAAESYVLLDCGEGTWGQIVRFFGNKIAQQVLCNLRAIYISHLHADHHIGLLGIFKAREELFGQKLTPLILLAPQQIQSWLDLYDLKIEAIRANYTLVPNGDFLTQPLTSSDLINNLGISSIRTCLVRHCPHAFGVSIELNKIFRNEPVKITYSGDTMPCEELVELGMNSTILIHEATMEDELIGEAKMKMHSTISQAVEQGTRMKAQYTILTHFSQRYAKLPRIVNDLPSNTGIAFDNMEITLPHLEYVHLMYPILKILFSEHYDEMEQKSTKRTLKKERLASLNK